MAHDIASDRSYEVLQLRRLRGEVAPCLLDSTNRRLHRISGYRQFIGDVDEIADCARPRGVTRRTDYPERAFVSREGQ